MVHKIKSENWEIESDKEYIVLTYTPEDTIISVRRNVAKELMKLLQKV
jgi:hypothetical protein